MSFYSLPKKTVPKGITQDQIAADEDFCTLLASLKYLWANYEPMSAHGALYETLCHSSQFFLDQRERINVNHQLSCSLTLDRPMPGVAHITSEKQKPGPLDLALLFQQVVEVKRGGGNSSSTREILYASVAEYNKKATTKVPSQIIYIQCQAESDCNDMSVLCEIESTWRLFTHTLSIPLIRHGGSLKTPSAYCMGFFDVHWNLWRSSRKLQSIANGSIQVPTFETSLSGWKRVSKCNDTV